jgi:hypothetical protein
MRRTFDGCHSACKFASRLTSQFRREISDVAGNEISLLRVRRRRRYA